ncbi:HAMP domain-containing sensor histidine kinase [Pelagicoccus sp. SDUM812005]|uniref:HAMP domain-containing sensor histidine kinase n=1 Tax=Pelagicoccus sp. SDUM812005 TaxID=3041257 RepID=UPI00280E766D|nr:HAMP domain-containing sensor histidine kinase [Pelagicoccus sp. SDUM812005]MDQ8179031.1 HAMP domain-containing sensor histidine kinase [Pelagicoccus sp. SDUM812005]
MIRFVAPLFLAFGVSVTACLGQSELLSSPPPPRLNGIPFYQIYEEKDIENSSRANFITTAPDGRLFFGCENGLHSFDGTSWNHLLETPSTQQKVKCVTWTEYGVFAAGYGTIGRLHFEGDSGLRYEALNDSPLTKRSGEFYSKIHRLGNKLYFIGERSVAHLDLDTLELGATAFEAWVKGSAIYQGKLLVATTRDGIVQFDGNERAVLPAFQGFIDKRVILNIEVSEAGEVYFATESNELYQVPAGAPLEAFAPFPFRPDGAIRDLEFVTPEKLAISVAHQGIYFLDNAGQVLSTLDRSFDYRWGGANALHRDPSGTLWVQFNSTVGKVIANSPVSQIDERLTKGIEYPIAHEVDGQVYLRTKGRLLKPDFCEDGSLQGFADALPGFNRSIDAASAIQDGIYLQGEASTYFHTQGQTTELGKTGRIERMTPFEGDANKLFAATPDSLLVLQARADSIEVLSQTSHQAGHINKVARAYHDVFWLEIGIGQIARAQVANGTIDYQLFNRDHGLPLAWIAVWEHEGEVLFTSSKGIYRFEPNSQRFVATDILEQHLPASGIFHRVATDPHGNIWASYEKSNYILWKQGDGAYLKDSHSLSQLGDQFFNQFKFLSNGDTLLLSATELFHIEGAKLSPPSPKTEPNLSLFEISDLEGSAIYYLNSGIGKLPESLEFPSGQRNLSIRVGATRSSTIKAPQYQYLLEGMSKDWSKWSSSNEVSFTKLDAGSYTLRIRSRPHASAEPEEIAIPLHIAPTFFETPIAYLLYACAFVALLLFGYSLFAKNLKKTNLKLERMVNERTREIENKNSELQRNANELSKTLDELRSAQGLLMGASRKAGMAEVATNVLHNVGNVLNSINVSLLAVSERLSQQRINKLVRVSKMINDHQHDLAHFLTNDPKGKAIPEYLMQLSSVLGDDHSRYLLEVDCMQENIEHVKKIIATQQTHAKTVDVCQPIKVESLVNDALEMITGDLEHSFFEIVRDFEPDLEIVSDKHSLLQMITNFVKNAKEAIIESEKPLGLITISAHTDPENDCVRIQISDNGIGIAQENERKIFTHGFTTKADGHGFGMHSCAIAARNLGGNLQISSEGLGKGATVTLELPRSPNGDADRRHANRLSGDSPFAKN